MASLFLPSPSSSSTSSSSSLFSRCSFNHRSFLLNESRSRINGVKCDLGEPLNGKPCIPILVDGAPPKFLASKRLESAFNRNNTRLKIFSGTANPSLSQEIAWYMGLDLGKIKIKRFADGEVYVQLQESVRGCDVYLVQPTCPPANENLMELLIMIDACRRASAKNITAVIPYFGYARADRKTQGRESIAAKLVANLITEAGADRVLACDLHSGQSIGYFDIPVDHVYCQPVILDYLASKTICSNDMVVVSPDVGGVARARAFAKKLSDAPLAIVDKRRYGHNLAELSKGAMSRGMSHFVFVVYSNALKLVTVAQSKRELTPDIVKAALHGPASAKIPAPQINLAATPAPHLNSIAAAPTPQMGPVAPTASQTLGFRGQVPPNATMNQQYFPSQGNQSLRPPLPQSSSNALRPPQGVASPDFSRGGSVAGPALPNSVTANNWLGGRMTGVSTGASHVPNQGVSQSMSSTAAKPQDPFLSASAKDSKATVGSGNGFSSDPVFGGDVFSAAQSLSKHDSPTYSVSSAPASSAIVPVSTGPPSSSKPDPFAFDSLQTLTRQPTGNQQQHTQALVKPNQQVSTQNTSSFASSGISVGPGNSTPNQSLLSWPKMTPAGIQKYTKVFVEVDTDRDGKITGEQARNLFLSWRLPREVLKQVWDLSDQDNDSMLSLREFCVALYLMERFREGRPLPPTLPSNILLDETLLSLTGQPNASYGNVARGPTAGFRPQQGMPGARPVASAAGMRPPVPGMFPQADGTIHFDQQKARMHLMESSHGNQLSNGEQNTVDTESAETEKKVEDKDKVYLDSKEKIEFYRSKMQDLVLYKSRCENRLNEITERAIADKREAELLGKKYEEKYKQVAETASKLTIEEAAFREIQERKMELQQAITKMEQGGSADGILQVRADRIQSDLEELTRAFTERCKKHGIDIKSTAVIELPTGWQPGIPEISSVWDEDWDKFEDEGFLFDVAMPPKTKSTSAEKENYSPNGSLSPDLMSHADDDMSDKLFSKGERAFESESAYTHSEDESGKSPSSSPARHTAFESPSREYSDNHFKKSPEADAETHRSFDEPSWGTFDNNDDVDSVWGFNPSNPKDSDHEKHGEKYFFGSSDMGASPRTDSPQSDSMFRKKSPFAFDDSVPGSPLSRAGNSPRYGGGSTDQYFDNLSRFDSFSMHDQSFSPRKETLSRFDSINSTRSFDHNNQGTFSRFDSINSTRGVDHSQGTHTRFDSMSSSRGFDHRHGGFSSFDDADPFGSSGPFKVSSLESQTPKKGSESWSSF